MQLTSEACPICLSSSVTIVKFSNTLNAFPMKCSFLQMATGQIGLNGILVVPHVETAIKHAQELVQTLHQIMEAVIVVTPTLKLRFNPVIYKHVKK